MITNRNPGEWLKAMADMETEGDDQPCSDPDPEPPKKSRSDLIETLLDIARTGAGK